jgi:hypothetical protein
MEGPRLDHFFEQIQALNPFLDNRVNGPSADNSDVEDIHRAEFERLTALAREMLTAGRGVGAVLWGEAGVGKSHLLSRLGRWAAQDRRACFVYLHNLQAAPEQLPRSLLLTVVSILTGGRRRLFQTPLYDLVRAALFEAVGRRAGTYYWAPLERAYAAWVDQLGRQGLPGAALFDRTVYGVLYRLFRSASLAAQGKEDGGEAELAVRWLAGQALDPPEALHLGLPPGRHRDDPTALEDNQQVKQVLVALTQLAAAARRPFVLALDQVDNLDTEQAAALARFLEALIDSSPNLLVVTAGIQASLLRWREQGVLQHSAWDRVAQVEVALHRLSTAEATAVVRSRLQKFLAPFAALGPVRQRAGQDALFPLGQAWHARTLRDKADVRPRDAINWAREGWRRQQERLRQQGGPEWLADWPGPDEVAPPPALPPEQELVDRKVAEKMAGHVAWRRHEPEGLPADADRLAGLIYTLLAQCRDADHRYGVADVERLLAPRRDPRRTYDLTLLQRFTGNGPDVRTALLVLTAPSAKLVVGFLRRLLEDPRPLDRLFLVTDQRVGLPLGERGQEYLEQLRHSPTCRFRELELTFDEYAELDALAAVVALAQSGDLEVEPRPGEARAAGAQEVIASHHRQNRYLATRLLRELLAAPEPKPAHQPEALAP